MAQISRSLTKSYFETSDVPTQSQFESFLDSVPFYDDAVFTAHTGTTWDGTFKTRTLTANLALTFSSTKRSGALIVTQDATGSRTLSINGTSVSINTAANSQSLVTFIYNDVAASYIFSVDTNIVGSISGGGGGGTTPLSAPLVNMTANSSTAMTITWTDVANEDGYTVQIATNSGFTTGVQTASKGVGVLSHQFTGLTASTLYYGRVKAVGSGSYSDSAYGTDSETTSAAVSTASMPSKWLFNETSGNAADSQGTNPLTNVNGVTYVAGKVNNAAHFVRSSSQYLKGNRYATQTGFAMNFWIKIASTTGLQRIISQWDDVGNKGEWLVYINNISGHEGRLHFVVTPNGSTVYDLEADAALSIGTWQNVTIKFETNLLTLTLNGVNSYTLAGPSSLASQATNEFRVGTDMSTADFFDGDLDILRIEAAIDTTENSNYYNGGSGTES